MFTAAGKTTSKTGNSTSASETKYQVINQHKTKTNLICSQESYQYDERLKGEKFMLPLRNFHLSKGDCRNSIKYMQSLFLIYLPL